MMSYGLVTTITFMSTSTILANVDGPVPQVPGRPETAGKTLDFYILAGLQKKLHHNENKDLLENLEC